MNRPALLLLFVSAACKKPPPPPPPAVVATIDASAPVKCDLVVETKTADVHVVRGWLAAHRKAAGFEEHPMSTEQDAKDALCRMDACAGAPPWHVRANVTPHPFPLNLVAQLADKQLAVLRVGSTGADFCDGPTPATNRFIEEAKVSADVVLYDEEVTPLRRGEEGGCESSGPPVHAWHVVDVRTKKELVLRGKDLVVDVHGRTISITSPGCRETRPL